MNGSLGFNLPRAGKPEHVGSLGEGSPRQCGSPPPKAVLGDAHQFCICSSPSCAASSPGMASTQQTWVCLQELCRSPQGAAAATAELPSPARRRIPPHPQLVLVGTTGLYLRLKSWIVVLSSRKDWLSDRPSGCAMRPALSCKKAERDEAFGVLVLGAVGWRTLVTAQTKRG